MPQNQTATAIRDELIDVLGQSLTQRMTDWVTKRQMSGVEQRWKDDLAQYNGDDIATGTLDVAARAAGMDRPERPDSKTQRSRVYVNVTRPKTNAAEARLANMLLPTDERNFAIRPTPSPTLSKIAKQVAMAYVDVGGIPMQGSVYGIGMEETQAPSIDVAPPPPSPPQPMGQPPMGQPPMPSAMPAAPQPAQEGAQMAAQGAPAPQGVPQPTPEAKAAQELIKAASEKAVNMQREIDDQLSECDWNTECRAMLHDCCILGTGVMKGPEVVKKTSKVWAAHPQNPSVWILQTKLETTVASRRVSPWMIYPDPSCGDDIHNGSGVFELKLLTDKQVRDLSRQPGYNRRQLKKVLQAGPQTPRANNIRDADDPLRQNLKLYECWEYWGEFDPIDLRACGVDIPEDTLETVSGCCVLIGGHVIKAFVNPLEGGGLPYDVMQWEKVDNSVWGVGIPFLARPAQRVLTTAWRQIMDNAGLAVGPNVIIKRGIVEPANGRWELTGRKVWYCTDASANVNEAFTFFDIPSHINEFQLIIELALKFIDEETGVPVLAQGQKDANVETVGGMQLLMNSANVVLTRLAKQFDDSILRCHIRRYYDYNMEHSPKENIKGDFQVEPRGSTALLVKDQQAQAMLALGQFQGSPLISPLINWDKWFAQILKLQHIEPTEIMRTDEEIAQIKAQPEKPDPNMAKAQATIEAAKVRAQADVQRTQIETQGEHVYAKIEAQNLAMTHQAKMQELAVKRELAMLDYAQKHQLSLEQVKAQLAMTSMAEDTKRQVAALKAQTDQSMKAIDSQQKDRHKALDHDSAERQFAATHNDQVAARNQASQESERAHAIEVMKHADEMARRDTEHRDQMSLSNRQHDDQMSLSNRQHDETTALNRDKAKMDNDVKKRQIASSEKAAKAKTTAQKTAKPTKKD